MNEKGLALGMAAVPPGGMQVDPSKETIGSLGILREILDHAGTVEEAVALVREYNIDFTGGPPIHYLIADATGKAVLVEFYRGEMSVIGNDRPWHSATNFLRSAVEDPADGNCWRYDRINARLEETRGSLDSQSAMQLLSEVAQSNTQWSIVYQMAQGTVSVAMGREYANIQIFPAPDEWEVNK
jgi:choloylglycine hydrolase